ncbi:hypothetical protein F5884DRAFT_201445 [Xylogone sp. PMI_703]|nr:hypothetical protein F5884DRAFT_201445 [Xylogone sp. PMI_703]
MASNFSLPPRLLIHLPNSRISHILLILLVGGLATTFLIHHSYAPSSPYRVKQPRLTRELDDSSIDWEKFKYVQYAASPESLCNAVMIWRDMETIGSRAQRVLFHSPEWSADEIDESAEGRPLTPIARVLHEAEKDYYVHLRPLEALRQDRSEDERWPEEYTSLLGFNLTEYDRVLVLNSGSVLKGNLDELFLIPPTPVAMPYVYFGPSDGWKLSSSMVLIEPSTKAFNGVQKALKDAKDSDESDVATMEKLYGRRISMLPQRPYSMLTSEFRRQDHQAYIGDSHTEWNPELALQETKFIHFFDRPMLMPWVRAPQMLLNRYMPKCSPSEWFGASDCRDRETWFNLYFEFERKRMSVCGVGSELKDRALPLDSDFILEDESHSR